MVHTCNYVVAIALVDVGYSEYQVPLRLLVPYIRYPKMPKNLHLASFGGRSRVIESIVIPVMQAEVEHSRAVTQRYIYT